MKDDISAVRVVNLRSTLDETAFKEWEITEISVRKIRDIIPAHCFERNTFLSFFYLFKDLFYIGILGYFATWIDALPFTPLRLALWLTYWALQSIVGTGLWMICHECGHYAFSSSKAICDGVGMIIHTFMLVPYYSWKFTHARHHNSIGHITRDKTHTPRCRSITGLPTLDKDTERDGPHSIFESTPLVDFLKLCLYFLVAWPYYVLFNTPGDTTKDRWVSHFNPSCFLFEKNQYWKVVQSVVSVGCMLGVLIYACKVYGLVKLTQIYIIPHVLIHAWMIIITYLQHTAPEIPRYDSDVWSYQRGVALTVDRSYGAFLNDAFHHIADTHFIHHIIPNMPHYHAVEATEYLKKALGKHYRYDDTPIAKAIFNSWTKCKFMEDEGSVRFYKN
ncbi:delta-12-fatty acid desaturase [Phycomyces nitens]|nr:delta-12-fatty acid desaturase [Phycomyces nitens]